MRVIVNLVPNDDPSPTPLPLRCFKWDAHVQMYISICVYLRIQIYMYTYEIDVVTYIPTPASTSDSYVHENILRYVFVYIWVQICLHEYKSRSDDRDASASPRWSIYVRNIFMYICIYVYIYVNIIICVFEFWMRLPLWRAKRRRKCCAISRGDWLMIAFITCNSNLVPLLEGLCSSNPCRFEFSIFWVFAGSDLARWHHLIVVGHVMGHFGLGHGSQAIPWALSISWATILHPTVFGKHCECIAQKCTHLERLLPLSSHLLLLSHCVLTRHGGKKKHVTKRCMLHPRLEPGSIWINVNVLAFCAVRTFVPNRSYRTNLQMSTNLNFKSQLFAENGLSETM